MDIREFMTKQADIVKLISMSGVTLEPTGRHFQGICPMCDELYPSLNVYPDEKRFECFLCGRKGDVTDFAATMMGAEDERQATEIISALLDLDVEGLQGSENGSKKGRSLENIAEGIKIVEGKVKTINPAQDFKDGVGYICIKAKLEIKEKGVTRNESSPLLITSEKEIFSMQNVEPLHSRGIDIHNVPKLIQRESRWPYHLLERYLLDQVRLDLGEFLTRLTTVYDRFLEFPEPGIPLIMALWSIGTYFYKVFETYPYIYIHGTKGSGKTKCLLVANHLCFNSLMSSDISQAALFRVVEASSPTLLIDEAERLKGKKINEDLVRLLNAGYKKGNTVSRTHQNTFEVETFEVYCPKMMAGIRGIDSVLEDRCIGVTMIKSLDPKKANLSVTDRAENWGEIRHLLYCFALDHFAGIMTSYEKVAAILEPESMIKGRKGELWFPLLSIAYYIDSYAKTKHFTEAKAVAERSIKEAEQDSLDEWSTALLMALDSMFKERGKGKGRLQTLTTTATQIQKVMMVFIEEKGKPVPLVWIGQQLKRWKIGTKKRTKNGMEHMIEYSELQDRMKRYLPKKED